MPANRAPVHLTPTLVTHSMRAVNLLTPEMRSSQKGSSAPRPAAMTTPGGVGAIALLGALALIVAGVAGYVLSTNVVKQKQSDLAAVSAKNQATVKRATALKPYSDFQTLAQQRAATVQALASARFDWEQSFRDLSRALPKDVYLSTLTGTVGGGSAGGGAGSGIRSSISSPAIELGGCTKTQPGVARLMSRLRNVQGVTRVSLSKSEKSDTAAANGSGATGGSTVGPCGKGSPPSFELVVFFEKAAVADALATATGDTSSATGGTAGASTATATEQANATGKGTDDSAAKASSTPAATPGG
jgi:Tfp pilus assembly protein PilN